MTGPGVGPRSPNGPDGDVLYGPPAAGGAAAPAAAPAPSPTSTRDADVMYGDPAIIERNYASVLKDGIDRFSDRTGTQAPTRDVALLFHDANIPPSAAAAIGSQLFDRLATPASPEEREQWTTEARRQLRERYGPEEAAKRLELVRAFIASRPVIEKELARSGFGSNPALVAALAENARNLRPRSK